MEGLVVQPFRGPDRPFWHGKRVLLTGHSGFKGSWLALWLHRLGVSVTGISLPPDTEPNLFSLAAVETVCDSRFCDVRDPSALSEIVAEADPEIVLHLAAQPLVRASYRDPLATFAINVMGVAHLLEALRSCKALRAVVMVTTDKVYRNNEWPWPYREDDALGGHDPYSASKAAGEIVIASYRDSFLATQGVPVASARAGNVIGGGDWSQDRLIPDAVRAWQSGETLRIRSPDAIRPWQHVLEPLAGYLVLAEALWRDPALAGAYNFGPETGEIASVREVVELARAPWRDGTVHYGEDGTSLHEAGRLALEIAKARDVLGFRPRWSLTESVARTMAWYCDQCAGAGARSLCEAEIAAFEAAGQ